MISQLWSNDGILDGCYCFALNLLATSLNLEHLGRGGKPKKCQMIQEEQFSSWADTQLRALHEGNKEEK